MCVWVSERERQREHAQSVCVHAHSVCMYTHTHTTQRAHHTHTYAKDRHTHTQNQIASLREEIIIMKKNKIKKNKNQMASLEEIIIMKKNKIKNKIKIRWRPCGRRYRMRIKLPSRQQAVSFVVVCFFHFFYLSFWPSRQQAVSFVVVCFFHFFYLSFWP